MSELALTYVEQTTLTDCEERIERGIQTFVEVGTALMTIRDQRLYRGEFQTFEAYCQERWQISRPRAYELMRAAAVVSAMADTDAPAPTNERQARELAKVPEVDRVEVWREAHERTSGKPTASAVAEIRQERDPLPPHIAEEIEQRISEKVRSTDHQPAHEGSLAGEAGASRPAPEPSAVASPEPAGGSGNLGEDIANAKAAAKTAPAHVAYKALEHMNLARQIIAKAGGVDAILDDLASGPIDPTDVWLIPIESAMATFEELRAGLRRSRLRSVR